MNIKERLKEIEWKQPRYALPAIIYGPLLFTGYMLIDTFYTEPLQLDDKQLQSTEYLNPELPQAQIKSDGIGGRYENMAKSFGRIQDYSAVENIDRDGDVDAVEEYNSKYSDDDMAYMEQEENQEQLAAEWEAQMQEREQQNRDATLAELDKALAEMRLRGKQKVEDAQPTPSATGATGTVELDGRAVTGVAEGDAPTAVVKRVKGSSDYFNTLGTQGTEPRLIKAIIDEDIRAVDGSRVRLRLLDDVEVGEVVLPKGAYLYAEMSGFGSQRVKGNVKSVMVGDDIVKVSLSIYDTDGLEGLYVPASSFRETSQDIASSALSGNVSINSGSYTNSFSQWGMQAIQNAYQRTSNALSKAVKKNKAKLKYGTEVYLVNGR